MESCADDVQKRGSPEKLVREWGGAGRGEAGQGREPGEEVVLLSAASVSA